MKKAFQIIIIVALVLVGFGFGRRLYRKIRAAKDLRVSFCCAKLSSEKPIKSPTDLATITIQGDAVINNFSDQSYTLEQIYLEVWSKDGKTLVARPSAPIKEQIEIKPNGQTAIPLSYEVSTASVLETLFKQRFTDLIKVIAGLKPVLDYISMRGYVRANGFKINLNTADDDNA